MGCEVPIVPKAMMENILASEALARVREGGRPFASAADWINNPYHNMPPQRFPTIKLQPVTFLQSNQPGTSSTMVSPMPLPLSNSVAHGASQAVGGGLGVLPVVKHEKNPQYSENLESKGKRKNKNRVNGLVGKKAKTDSSTDPVLSNGDRKPPSGRSRKRLSSGEGTGKTSSKRQSCRGMKNPENDTEHKVVNSNENVLKDSALQACSNSGSNGLLDIYGLKTRPIDLSHHIFDISVNDVLSDDFFYPPRSDQPGNEVKHSTASSSIVKGVSKVLQLMPNSIHTEDKERRVENSSGLEFKSQLEEFWRVFQYTNQQKENCAADSSSEPSDMKFSSLYHPAFPLAMCPLSPIQDFVSRLGLPTNEPLEDLIVKADRQPDINNDPNSHVSSTGSIPPLKHSALQSGSSRSPLKSGKESKNRSPWLRAGIVKCANDSLEAGSGLGLAVKNNTNVECEQKERERLDKDVGSEKIKRAFMIDLNVESFEQLHESAMVDSPDSFLLPEMAAEKNSSFALHKKASESRNGGKDIRDSSASPCHSGCDHSISEKENLQRRNMSFKIDSNSDKLPALQLETLKSQTPNIQDANNGIVIEVKLKTIQSREKLTQPEKVEEFEEQMLEPRTLKGFQTFSADQSTFHMGETSQCVPSDLQTLQLGLDKGLPSSEMPDSPQVEAAAMILFDMANSLFHNNGASLDKPTKEDSCDMLQSGSLKSSTIVNRLVISKMVSESNLKAVEESGNADTKAPRTEKRKSRVPSSIVLAKKNTSKGTDVGTMLNQFQNKTFDSALRNNNTKQGLKGNGKHNSTEAEEESDIQSHMKSSGPSKPIRDDVDLKSVLCTTNQNRGNLPPKSFTGGKMHISTKSNTNIRSNIGNQKFTLSREQNQRKVVSVGDVNNSRLTASFADRKR